MVRLTPVGDAVAVLNTDAEPVSGGPASVAADETSEALG